MTPNILLLIVTLCTFSVYCGEWSHHSVLDQRGKFQVWWTATDKDVTFQVEVRTRGWVGFGISPDGQMPGSDVVIGWVVNDRAAFHDRYAVRRSMPVVDDHQDWEFLWCCENDTHTTLRFKRPLETCDGRQDVPIKSGMTWLVYAYNDEDPSSPTTVGYHGAKRGSKHVSIFQRARITQSDDRDVEFWDVTSPNVLIPDNKDSAYLCSMTTAPKLSKKHHIIRIEPIIEAGNERFVRHMTLYKCPRSYRLQEYMDCYSDDLNSNFQFCQHMWVGWAVGGEAFRLPDHVGIPIEEAYYRLEVHYHNPRFESGVYDNSGLRLVHTSNLRQYESDLLTIGSHWHPCFVIPPKENYFLTAGHAHSDCLKKGLPREGINVFAVSMHARGLGKTVTIRHFRDNEELPPISSEVNYDTKNQGKRLLIKERKVLPNDHLTVECGYDSSRRNSTVFGGLGTKDEMCLAFLSYYPISSLQSSMSCPSPKELLRALGVEKSSRNSQFVTSPFTGRDETYMDFLKNYPWHDALIKVMGHIATDGPHITVCNVEGDITATKVQSMYPEVTKVHRETSNLCDDRPPEQPQTRRPYPTNSTPQILFPSSARPTSPVVTSRPGLSPPMRTRPPAATSQPRRPQTTPSTKRRKKVPQTIPYEFIDQIVAQFG